MNTLKLFHILFMVIWIGQLMTLTRLLGYSKKLSLDALQEMIPIYYRMYFFVELPSMVLTVALGVILLTQKMTLFKLPYFHLKLTLVFFLILADLYLGRSIFKLKKKPQLPNSIQYKILHGICGLCLIAIFYAIYVMKPAALG